MSTERGFVMAEDASIETETPDAVLVNFHDRDPNHVPDERLWIPKSVMDMEEMRDNHRCVVRTWWATERGYVDGSATTKRYSSQKSIPPGKKMWFGVLVDAHPQPEKVRPKKVT